MVSSEIVIQDTSSPPDALLALLRRHLPHSLPVLRRFQFARNFTGGSTPDAHVLRAYYAGADADAGRHFAAAYLDLTRGLETECWLYTTLEDSDGADADDDAARAACDDLVLALLRRARTIAARTPSRPGGSGSMLLGGVNEIVRTRLLARAVRMAKTPAVPADVEWDWCGKWLFRVDELGAAVAEQSGLPEGMRWDTLRQEDVRTVQARTSIPRQECVSPTLSIYAVY